VEVVSVQLMAPERITTGIGESFWAARRNPTRYLQFPRNYSPKMALQN